MNLQQLLDLTYGGVGSADGAYTITGASGTDIIDHTIAGNAQLVEVFVLGSGNDSMIANRYAETISMGAGNDTVQTGSWSTWLAGGDVVDGGDGNDWLDYSYYNSPNTIIANLATGRVTAGGATAVDTVSNFENVLGGTGNDTLVGDTNANILNGGLGNDSIIGGGGNDTIYGGIGLDSVTTGAGDDLVYLTNDTTGTGEGWDGTWGSVRNSATVGEGNNTVVGSNANDSIVAGSGNDSILALNGNDTIQAGDGNNTILGYGTAEIYVTTGTGNDYIVANGGDNSGVGSVGADNRISAGDGNNTVLTGGNNDSIVTGSGNDSVNAGSGWNIVTLGAGDDYLTGGADTVNAGTGIDTLDHSDATGNYNVTTVAGGALILTNNQGWNDSVLMDGTNNVEVFMFGSGADTWRGLATMSTTSETVLTSSGNDYVYTNSTVGSVTDYYDGGAGTDTIDLSSTSGNLYIDMASGVTSVSGGAAFDTAVHFESFVTGSGNDTIIGTANSDTIDGGAGNDSLIGGAGADTLNGRADNDYYKPGAGNDRVGENTGGGTDTVDYSDATSGVTITTWTGSSSNGAFDVTGGSGTDQLYSNGSSGAQLYEVFVLSDFNDFMRGTQYSETINMGAGDDTIQTGTTGGAVYIGDSVDGGAGNNWIDYSYLGSPNVNINLVTGISSVTGAASADTLTNFENVYALGTTGSVTVTGRSADNIIYSSTGADSIIGGGGNDTINTSSGNDYISTGTGNASIIAAVNNGGQDNDTVVAAGGNNYIYTSDGNDNVTTGAGDDTIDVGTNNSVGSFTSGGTVTNDNDNTNFVNAGDGNNVVIGGSGTDNIITGSGNDSVNTYAGSDAISVGTGSDTVFAGANDDAISYVGFNSTDAVDGGTGRDVLYLDGSGTIDLSGIPDINIESIEVIDLGGSGGSDVLTLNLADLNVFADPSAGPKFLFVRGDVGDQITGTGWSSNVTGYSVNLDMVNDGIANDNIADSNLGGIDGFANGNAGTFVTGTYVAYNVGSTWLFVENDLTRTLS